MKAVFFGIFVVLAMLGFVTRTIQPKPTKPGVIELVWVTDENPVRQEQVDLFNRLNPDLHLSIDPVNTDQQKVIVQSIGGVGPDIFSSWGNQSLQAYVKAGIAYDATEYLNQEHISAQDLMWPVGLDSCVYEGRTYGFGCNVAANAIWYNKDLFDKAGVPYPKPGLTWDQLIEISKKLTARDKDGKPIQFGLFWDYDRWRDLVLDFGGRQFTPDGTQCTLDSPEAIAAVQLSHDLMYKYRIAPTPVEQAALATSGGWQSGAAQINYLIAGRVAMASGGRWWLNLIRKTKKMRLGVIEMPYTKVKCVTGGSRVAIVNKNGPHLKESLRFLKFLASREYNELLNDQADALAPVKKYCYTDRYLHNPQYPEEDYNEVWRACLERAVPEEHTDFLIGSEFAPINDQFDLVKADAKPVDQAMRDATKNANERIQRLLTIRPYLKQLYDEAKAKARR